MSTVPCTRPVTRRRPRGSAPGITIESLSGTNFDGGSRRPRRRQPTGATPHEPASVVYGSLLPAALDNLLAAGHLPCDAPGQAPSHAAAIGAELYPDVAFGSRVSIATHAWPCCRARRRWSALVREDLSILLYIDVYKRSVMTELTISEARKALLDLPEKLARTPERAVTITRRGQPVLAILPWELYESIVETLEILGDPEMATALRESLEDVKRGRVVSHAEARKRLGV
jgi:prevent-host-death family protein